MKADNVVNLSGESTVNMLIDSLARDRDKIKYLTTIVTYKGDDSTIYWSEQNQMVVSYHLTLHNVTVAKCDFLE